MPQTQTPDRIAVVGAGAIGGVVAARLAEAGQRRVVLCTRKPLSRLVVDWAGVQTVADVDMSSDPATAMPAKWIFLATKAQETASAAPWLERLCAVDSTLVVLQNGIDQEERVRPYAGEARILPVLVYIGAERVDLGHIVQHSRGRLIAAKGDAADELAVLLRSSGIDVDISEDFLTASWLKLLGNIFANPITALTMRRAEVFDDPDIFALARQLVAEAVAVGRMAGAQFADDQVTITLEAASRLPKDSGSSMLYDRLAGRPLEHHYLTGAVVRTAERLGIDVPQNRAALTLLNALSEGSQRR